MQLRFEAARQQGMFSGMGGQGGRQEPRVCVVVMMIVVVVIMMRMTIMMIMTIIIIITIIITMMAMTHSNNALQL